MFSTNEGNLDRIVRVVVGVVMIAAYFMFPNIGAWGWALWIGVIPLATGVAGWCPLYALFGLSTCPMKKA